MPGTGDVFNLASQEAEADKAMKALEPALKGKTIGVQGSSIYAKFAENYLKDIVEVREYKTSEAQDLDLSAGRIDAIL